MKKTVTIVDPPTGWAYGFPAVLEDDYRAQLIKANYPDREIEIALKYSRYWTEEFEVIDE